MSKYHSFGVILFAARFSWDHLYSKDQHGSLYISTYRRNHHTAFFMSSLVKCQSNSQKIKVGIWLFMGMLPLSPDILRVPPTRQKLEERPPAQYSTGRWLLYRPLVLWKPAPSGRRITGDRWRPAHQIPEPVQEANSRVGCSCPPGDSVRKDLAEASPNGVPFRACHEVLG